MEDNKRPPATMRGYSPCFGCTEKFTACHDRCPKDKRGEYGHDAWKAELERQKKNRSEFLDQNRRKIWQIKNG